MRFSKFKDLTAAEKLRYLVGKLFFWVLMPLWVLLMLTWWKQNTAFIMRHINFIFCGVDEL